MKKNFIVLLIVAILCSGMVFAANTTGKQTGTIPTGTITGKNPLDDPTLTLQWTLAQTLDKWEIGFTNAAVNSSATVSPIASLDFDTVRAAGDVHGEATAYVYWQLDTSYGLSIAMEGSGPMTTGEATEDKMLNWQATFNPVSVNTQGNAVVSEIASTIGTTDNATDALKDTHKSTYNATNVFYMTDANAAVGTLQRYGSAEVKIVTQNALDKTQGDYAANLKLTVAAVE